MYLLLIEHLLAIGEDVSFHCGLGSTERKAHDGHAFALPVSQTERFLTVEHRVRPDNGADAAQGDLFV